MITLQEWNAMNGKEQTIWLEGNCQVNARGKPRGLVEGVGVNDAPYCTQPRIDGKQVRCPAYRAWTSIITRAYSAKFHVKCPTYMGIEICEEWKNFCTFRTWWIENQVDGYEIDKDILSDSSVYSPETCLFVPVWLNSFILDSAATRGSHPIGASFHKQSGRFKAQCRNPRTLVNEYIGLFNTSSEAHEAWKSRKISYAEELKNEMDLLDSRIFDRVVGIIKNLK